MLGKRLQAEPSPPRDDCSELEAALIRIESEEVKNENEYLMLSL